MEVNAFDRMCEVWQGGQLGSERASAQGRLDQADGQQGGERAAAQGRLDQADVQHGGERASAQGRLDRAGHIAFHPPRLQTVVQVEPPRVSSVVEV